MNWFLNDIGTVVENTICLTIGGITYKYTFITPWIKFAKVFLTIIVNATLTSKGLEMWCISFLAFEQFIWCLFKDWSDEVSIKNIIWSVNSLSPSWLKKIIFTVMISVMARSSNVQFFLSTTPFCCRILGAEELWEMPFFHNNQQTCCDQILSYS